jgi:hypothetical protein
LEVNNLPLVFKLPLFIVLLVGMPILVLKKAPDFIRAYRSSSWPRSEAVISGSGVKKSFSDGETMYEADIEYEYRVADVRYRGDRIRAGKTPTKSWEASRDFAKRFPVGAEMPVYYNPDRPADSYLFVGPDLMHYVDVVLPLCFWLIALLGLRDVWVKTLRPATRKLMERQTGSVQ